jgi:inward rectifier potassium channel
MFSRVSIFKPPGADYEIRVVGARATPLRDFYHGLLRLPWWATLTTVAVAVLAANVLFALAYVEVGGVAHAAPGSFADAFFFSVQTMGSIGYGIMYPESRLANLLVVAESITGLSLFALVTGLVFAKFSRSTGRIVFSREAVISPVDGVPTLSFRIGNERGNRIIDAQIRVVLVRTERRAEGDTFYRMRDLKLSRGQALTLARSWSVLHPMDDESPLRGQSQEAFVAADSELQVLVTGLDDVTMQTVAAIHQYFGHQVIWGARHVDVLSEDSQGSLTLDLRRFHDRESTRPTAEFPYPQVQSRK